MLKKIRPTVAGFLILAVGVSVALIRENQINHEVAENAEVASMTSCKDANEVRAGSREFVGTLTSNSRRQAAATLASPYATPAQKLAASKNLQAIRQAQIDADIKFKDKPCTYP